MGLFTGKERRGYVRLAIELSVEFKINGEGEDILWHKGATRNISTEGLSLVTDLFSKKEWEEIVKGKRHIYLQIDFPGHREKAEAEVERIEVEVVWHRHERKKEGKDIYHIGLQFTKIEKDSQEVIRRYITDSLLAKYMPA